MLNENFRLVTLNLRSCEIAGLTLHCLTGILHQSKYELNSGNYNAKTKCCAVADTDAKGLAVLSYSQAETRNEEIRNLTFYSTTQLRAAQCSK